MGTQASFFKMGGASVDAVRFGVYAVAATSYNFDYEIVNGTSMRINWGDGNTDTLTGTATASHTYSNTGTYNASIVPIDGDIIDFVYYFANNTLNFDGVVDFSKADNIAYFYHGQNVYFNGISLFKLKSNVTMSRFGYVTETSNTPHTDVAIINILEVSGTEAFIVYGVADLQLNENILFNIPTNFVSFRNVESSISGLTNTNNSFSFMSFGVSTTFDNFENLNFTNITSNTSSLNIDGICISTTQSDNLMLSIADSATLNNVQNKPLDFTNNAALSATGLASLAILTDPVGLNWTVTT